MNITHSYDGYIVRELHRRCNYNPRKILARISIIENYLSGNQTDVKHRTIGNKRKLMRLQHLALRFNTVSVRAVDYIDKFSIIGCREKYLKELLKHLKHMLTHVPFEVRTIHDEFAACPNHVTRMKQTYSDLLAEAYDSTWLFDIIQDLSGKSFHQNQPEFNNEVYEAIKENTYALN